MTLPFARLALAGYLRYGFGVEAWPLVGAVALVSIGRLFVTREDSSPA